MLSTSAYVASTICVKNAQNAVAPPDLSIFWRPFIDPQNVKIADSPSISAVA